MSDTKAHITIRCDEKVRVNGLSLFYNEALFKGLSEKAWNSIQAPDPPVRGVSTLILKDLKPGTSYKMYAVADNDFGRSPKSAELWFRTVDSEVEVKVT